jgi:alpha-mannosidase
LVTSFSAYQPRTFAIQLATPRTKVDAVRSAPVSLKYDLATASNDGTKSEGGFDGKGDALPAEMLPAQIQFNDVRISTRSGKNGRAQCGGRERTDDRSAGRVL